MIVIAILLILLVLSSCIGWGSVDYYSGKRPSDENNVIWVSQNPDIWFIVQDNQCYGEMNLYGEITKIEVKFDYGKGITVFPDHTNRGDLWMFMGQWNYTTGNNMFTMKVTNNGKGILDDSQNTLVFTKEIYDVGTRWYDEINSKWVSSSPFIWFIVDSSGIYKGEINFDGVIFDIYIKRHSGSLSWVFYNAPDMSNESTLFRIYCRYELKKIYAYVISGYREINIFDEEDKVLIFEKIEDYEAP